MKARNAANVACVLGTDITIQRSHSSHRKGTVLPAPQCIRKNYHIACAGMPSSEMNVRPRPRKRFEMRHLGNYEFGVAFDPALRFTFTIVEGRQPR